MKNKKIITIIFGVIAVIAFTFIITTQVIKSFDKKKSILATIEYLEKNYGDGKYAVTKSEKDGKSFKHLVETNYMENDIKIIINKEGVVLEENFIDQYGLEKYDLGNYLNVSEYIYMSAMERLKEKMNDKLNATINFQTVRFLDNYGYYNKGSLPKLEDLLKGVEFEQPSIKIKDEIKNEEQLLQKMKIIIKMLKEDLKDENIKYKNKFISYTFDGSHLNTPYDNGYIMIDDYDNQSIIRVNLLNKEIKIEKNSL